MLVTSLGRLVDLEIGTLCDDHLVGDEVLSDLIGLRGEHLMLRGLVLLLLLTCPSK